MLMKNYKILFTDYKYKHEFKLSALMFPKASMEKLPILFVSLI